MLPTAALRSLWAPRLSRDANDGERRDPSRLRTLAPTAP